MKKWLGGFFIIALALILFISLLFLQNDPPPPQKQSAYDFFGHNDGIAKPSRSHTILVFPDKAHFINVQGLNDLYSSTNISKQESNVMLVWDQMRALLSRSDALPETAQGVKEASVAWKELLAVMSANSSGQGSVQENMTCPFVVNMLNKSENGIILEFPCGLVQDSSITVIGVPDARYGDFQIQVMGSEVDREAEHSVVLYYNVSFLGDDFTKYPVIVQNAWTVEDGWGADERCPAHRPSTNFKVDGLVRCNVKLDRTVIEEKSNMSENGTEELKDSDKERNHVDSNFPFVEGNPFTSTLWAGLEGFHMTVNGRHETSLSYRKKLEPWLVSGVKVTGGLDVLSALANGLPISEDQDLAIGVEPLKAPPLSRKRVILLIGVFSTGNNFERRMALRKSWMQYASVRSGDVAVRFFIGLHKNLQVNLQLWKEAQTYGDIQLMPFVDYYSLITLKTIAICIMGTRTLPAKFIMKTDDDAFVRIEEILSTLKEKTPEGLLYGLISFDSTPHRDTESKWFISAEEWPHPSYPPWAHGPGYIISRDIAKFIVQGHQQRGLRLFKLEDVAMGIWIDQFKRSGKEVQYISDDRFYNAGCEADYILAHYQNPRMLLCLWDKLQKEGEAHCCE